MLGLVKNPAGRRCGPGNVVDPPLLYCVNSPPGIGILGIADPASNNVSGIVLAGGQSRRLGRDKAVEPFQGQPLIERVIQVVSQLTDETVVVVDDQARGDALPLPPGVGTAPDLYPGAGSLGGIFTGLSAGRMPWGLVVACDMPFVNLELMRYLLFLRKGVDVVVPVVAGRAEPTHALYSKECLGPIEGFLKAGELRITGFYDQVNVRYVAEEEIAQYDPDFLSFFNANSPEDLERANAWAARRR